MWDKVSSSFTSNKIFLGDERVRDATMNEEWMWRGKHTIEIQFLQWSTLLQSFCNSNGSFISNPVPCSTTHNTNNINIPPSVNIHSLRVNIFNQIILDHTRRVSYVQWKLTPKVNFHKRCILLQHFSYPLGTSHSNYTAYHSFIPHWWHKYEIK